MKRKWIIIAPIVTIILLSTATILIIKGKSSNNTLGISSEISDIKNVSSDSELSSGKNYKIYDFTKDFNPEYLYEIYNNSGKVVKSETVTRTAPTIKYLTDSLLSIEIGAGTDYWITQYYDTNSDLFSEIFESPLEVRDSNVVYITTTPQLIIRDIFDKTKYYKEFKLDFAPSANPVVLIQKVEFISDKELMVSYLAGKNYKEKTKLLQLD